MRKQVVNVKTLSGEPTDGSGKICIHLFVPDEHGPFVEPHVLHPVIRDGVQVKGEVQAKPTRGRLACDSKRNAHPSINKSGTLITPRTDDPRAVTCPKCIASEPYRQMMPNTQQVRT